MFQVSQAPVLVCRIPKASSHRPPHGRHFGQALCDSRQPTRECKTFPQPRALEVQDMFCRKWVNFEWGKWRLLYTRKDPRSGSVWLQSIQGRNVAFSIFITSASNHRAVTPQKRCMKISSGNLDVWHSLIQRRDIALPIVIHAAGDSNAIASQENSMTWACRHLDVWHSWPKGWNSALSISVVAASYSSSITSQKHCVRKAGRHLGIWQSLSQRWNIALSIEVISANPRSTIASQKHAMMKARSDVGVRHPLR